MYMFIFLILVIIVLKFICYVFVQSVCKHEDSVTIPRKPFLNIKYNVGQRALEQLEQFGQKQNCFKFLFL